MTIGVKPLAKTSVTPNQITTLRLLTGVSAAVFFAVGNTNFTTIGSIVFILSLLLDRADGVLARLKGKTTLGGHKYDLMADTISNSLVFIGIGVGLRHGQIGDLAIPLGFIAGLAVTTVFLMVVAAEKRVGNQSAELKSSVGLDPDDGMLLVPITMMLGFSNELIIVAAVGAPLFAIFFFFKFKHLFCT